MLAAFVDHGLDLAALQVDTLDRAADIFAGAAARHQRVARRIQLKPPLLQMYILPSGRARARWAARNLRDHLLAAVRIDPVSRLPRISTSTTDPSGMTTGPFRKFQIGGDERGHYHEILPASWLQADFWLGPARATFRCAMLWQSSVGLPTRGHAQQVFRTQTRTRSPPTRHHDLATRRARVLLVNSRQK
jgi:hypothetical protein